MSEDVAARVAPMRVVIAEEIRVLLARRRMSASELARQMGATQPYISRRLTGEIAFDLDDLEKIAAVLAVTPRDLLPGPKTRTNEQYSAHQPERQVRKPRQRPPARTDAAIRPPNRPVGPHRPVLVRGNTNG